MTAGVLSAGLIGGYGAVVGGGGGLSRTNRGSAAGTLGVRSLSAFTPANGSLLVAVFMGCGENPGGNQEGIATVAGGSLTWTKRASIGTNDIVYPTVRSWATIFTAPVVTGVSTTISGDENSASDQYSTALYAFELTGQHASPIGATATQARNYTGGSSSFSLSGSPASSSIVFAAAIVNNYTDLAASLVPGTGWTEQYSNDAVGVWAEDQYSVQTRTGSTSTTILWDTLDSTTVTTDQGTSASVALEIKAA